MHRKNRERMRKGGKATFMHNTKQNRDMDKHVSTYIPTDELNNI